MTTQHLPSTYTLAFTLTLTFPLSLSAAHPNWQSFNQQAFDQAKAENKLVLLDLHANWCHWCHVMEDSTYADPAVVAYLKANYITTEADQDAHPDLANRYRNYGWPATIVFDAEGTEIVKRRGFINPAPFLRLLEAIVADPSPEEERTSLSHATVESSLRAERIAELQDRLIASLDYASGGYDSPQKYVDYDVFEYAMIQPQDEQMQQWLDASMRGAAQLQDPVWGGMYQYSTHGDWKHLHFEKLLDRQARYIRMFTLYDQRTGVYEKEAERIVKYCDRFLLQPNGLFASAQDADLVAGEHAEAYFDLNNKGRLKQGIPRIDTNTYTNSNAAMAEALAILSVASGKPAYMKRALHIVEHILHHRSHNTGLFTHRDAATKTTLDDNLALAQCLLTLHRLTDKPAFKTRSINLLQKVVAQFQLSNGAFANPAAVAAMTPEPVISENIRATRLLNLAGHLWNDKNLGEAAQRSYAFLLSDAAYETYYIEAAMVTLAQEMESEPLHLVTVKTGTDNGELEAAARTFPLFYVHVETYPASDLPEHLAMLFGNVAQTTVFSCTETACSAPVIAPKELLRLIP